MASATSRLQDLFDANAKYAATHVPAQPFGSLATANEGKGYTVVISCFDPRSCPEDFFDYGHANSKPILTVRVPGGRATDAMSSLLIAEHLVGIARIVLVHHTDCGRSHIDPEAFKKTFPQEELKDVKIVREKDPEESVRKEVAWLKGLKFFSKVKDMLVVGMVYDVESGKVRVVE